MYLNAMEIRSLIRDEEGLAQSAQVGVDLTVIDIQSIKGGGSIKRIDDIFYLSSGGKYLIIFNQKLHRLDALQYNMKLIHRSSLYRMGGMIDYQFQIINYYGSADSYGNICATLYTHCDIKIQVESRLAQLIARDSNEFKYVSHTGRIDEYRLLEVSKVENGGELTRDKTILPKYIKIESVDGVFHCENGWYSFGFTTGCDIQQGTFSRILVNTERLSINSPIFDPGFKTNNVGTLGSVQSKDGYVDFKLGESLCRMYYFNAHNSEMYNGQWQNTRPDGSK